MTIKKPWKAEYWPQIIEEIRLDIEEKKKVKPNYNGNWPYIYDYARTLGKKIGSPDTGQYIYIQDARVMQKIVDVWHEIGEHTQSNIRRNMKGYENQHLLKAIYKKRKGEFDALVAENDS